MAGGKRMREDDRVETILKIMKFEVGPSPVSTVDAMGPIQGSHNMMADSGRCSYRIIFNEFAIPFANLKGS